MSAKSHVHATDDAALIASARRVILTEAGALHALAPRVDAAFAAACRIILGARGRVVLSGMGKSGHIARKIAATLASTGTPAFFVHPGEASHGDLGMITASDVVLTLSYSGETEELLTIMPLLQRQGIPLLAMTGKPHSTLARQANVHMDVSVPSEACPLGLAPTASTTAALALGDALAIALLEARGFTAEDFAYSHPAGSLGRRLLLRIEDVMHRDAAVPAVRAEASLNEALTEMSRKGLGMTAVIDEQRRLLGVFTDGDLRRALDNRDVDLRSTPLAQLMTHSPRTIAPQRLAGEAAQLMETHKIQGLLVIEGERLVGAVTFLDLLRAKVV
ncbi:MAG: KpsF/GutQ family sugar-phosphate isomerase [Metallibacterium scheffleri]|uniref:KpsF/GutQ family sugar-phosphate isomerase n=1 Tax=Metallibacterium scheffleri TaxID=993689 RepID=UPI0026EE7128|nr:KpsF/GutQ family sugar-phosphate isomerase [Metallibacterium scheffleri]MCK9367773.1 KpsF/GutQ family sugar-phosphate isomerase [Metallibacterium scheffleri]